MSRIRTARPFGFAHFRRADDTPHIRAADEYSSRERLLSSGSCPEALLEEAFAFELESQVEPMETE